jgi:hypothetical protein
MGEKSALKILFSEMDLAKNRLIRKVLIKGRGVEIFTRILYGVAMNFERALKG